MWRTGHCPKAVQRSGAKMAIRSWSSKPPEPPRPVRCAQPRPQAEKLRRRRERQQTISSAHHQKVADQASTWSEKQKTVYTAQTPAGTKKDTSLPFPSSYSPDYVESCWYQWWEKEGFFNPDQHESLSHGVDQTFSLCIPPPNVTGTSHSGHASTVAIQDASVRWRRMQGYRVSWVPGCDHAGIATQTVVERRLLREYGKRRHDFSREEFLQEVWKWKNEKGEEIYQQSRRLGASLDWSRACFTMDPAFSRAVTEAFVRSCDSDLIYRSEASVNWSCALQSAISDIEVDAMEVSGPTKISVPGYDDKVEFGTMFTFAYTVEGHDSEVAVSTTRPETMLGDVAVAVHPDDPRYQALHGSCCRHPFTDRLIPIITDTMVDMEMGTGAVKVTPAHDFIDFHLSQRHSSPRPSVIGGDGSMEPLCGQWSEGVKRFDARQSVVDASVEKKLFRGKKNHAMTLPICSRSGDIVEPLSKAQWFVRCDSMAVKAIQAVDDGELEIIPPYYTKTWKNWSSSISDWCISRQLWWGHQIPAYQVQLPNSTAKEEERWVWGRSEEDARQRAAVKYNVNPEDITSRQDPDVLDTWFSSASFPFTMLGWPEQTSDLQHFYPNSVSETGNDLIFFWVARMVMLGSESTGQLPFKQVSFHSSVRDKYGRKMSKSLGNVIDPLDVIHGISLKRLQEKIKEGNLDPREQSVAMEAQRKDYPNGIPQCGTDASRFALCSHKMQGEDISLSVAQILGCRHFCNKMWQTSRFTLGVLGDNTASVGTLKETSPSNIMDRWICSRLYSTIVQCEQAFEAYESHTVTSALYSFWVHNSCDVYMEYIKPVSSKHSEGVEVLPDQDHSSRTKQEARTVLYHCVSLSLASLSPFMPFITEESWQRLQAFSPEATAQTSSCSQPYPRSTHSAHWYFPEVEKDFSSVQDVIRTARSSRAQCGLTKEKPVMWAVCSPCQAQTLLRFRSAVWTLSRISNLHICCPDQAGPPSPAHSAAPPTGCFIGVVDHTCQLHLHIQSEVDINKQIRHLSQRRDKLLPKSEENLSRLQSFSDQTKTPADIRERMQRKISALKEELKTIEDQLKVLVK